MAKKAANVVSVRLVAIRDTFNRIIELDDANKRDLAKMKVASLVGEMAEYMDELGGDAEKIFIPDGFFDGLSTKGRTLALFGAVYGLAQSISE